VLSAVILGILGVGVVRRIAEGTASGILLYTAAQSSWNLFFAPFYSAFPTLVVALALAFVPVARDGIDRFRVGATPRLPSSRQPTG